MKVIDITFDAVSVNPARLHEEIRAVVGNKFVGVSLGPDGVRAHVEIDDLVQDVVGATAALQAQIQPVIDGHNPLALTPQQQAEADRVTLLELLRVKAWVEWSAEDKDTLLKILAERLLGRYLDV